MLEGNGGSHWEARSRPALLDFAPECLEAELRAVSGSKELLEQWEVHVWQGRAGQGAWGIIMHSAVVLMAYVLRGKGGYAWWAAPFQHYQTEASMQRGAAPAPTLARTVRTKRATTLPRASDQRPRSCQTQSPPSPSISPKMLAGTHNRFAWTCYSWQGSKGVAPIGPLHHLLMSATAALPLGGSAAIHSRAASGKAHDRHEAGRG